MKKIFVTIFFASSIAITANAQIRRQTDSTQNIVSSSGKRTERQETMNSLNLTKQQMNQLKEFRRTIKQQKEIINNDQSLSDEQQKRKLKNVRKEQIEKLKSMLTPEQIEKLKAARMKTGMKQGNINKPDN